jgi:hypothetical protein
MRPRCATRPEPKATRHRGTTKRQQALDPLLCGHAVDRRDN